MTEQGEAGIDVPRIRDTSDSMIGMAKSESRTSAATAARMRASENKAAQRLIERGWFCMRTGEVPPLAAGLAMYATNGLGETFQVKAFLPDGAPLLIAGEHTMIGIQSYVYTVGPA